MVADHNASQGVLLRLLIILTAKLITLESLFSLRRNINVGLYTTAMYPTGLKHYLYDTVIEEAGFFFFFFPRLCVKMELA